VARKPVRDANAKQPPRRAGSSPWTFAFIALALVTAGILGGTTLLWSQLVEPANREFQNRTQQANASAARAYFESRIVALRHQLEVQARAPDTRAAVVSGDPERIAAEAARLNDLMPYARRIVLFPAGTATVDLDASPPVTFAALDLVQRAETGQRAGPEAYRIDDSVLVYAAEPIALEGRTVGVLLAALTMDWFAVPLRAVDPNLARIELEQRFPNSAPAVMLAYGTNDTVAGQGQRIDLSPSHWALAYTPGVVSARPLITTNMLTVPLTVMSLLVFCGVMLAFALLLRTFGHDVAQWEEDLPGIVRGRAPSASRYRLEPFRALTTTAALALPDANAPETAPARSSPSPARASPPLTRTSTSAPLARGAEAKMDDFLDVSPSSKDDNFGIEVTETNSERALGIELDPLIFRAYDIRGIVDTNLTPDVVFWIGRAFGSEARANGQRRAVIGGDGRLSSPALRAALAKGIQESGVDVIDVGQVPTPVLYYATFALETGTGVVVTGSHNPPEYNGLKMMIAGETLAEQRITHLRERIERGDLASGDGSYEVRDIIADYIARVADDVAIAQPLKVVVDCGNGVAGAVAPEMLQALGCEVVPLYCDVDGTFPNHHPDPAEERNLADLISRVQAEGADLGLAFDGDGDRLGVVTNSGAIVWPDRLLMLFARDIVGRNPGADIIFDVKCSRHLSTLVSNLGGRPIMWKTGHSHMKAKLKETGALLAGEFSGHICFAERWYGFDDALYSAARLLEIVGSEGQSLDELVATIPNAFMTPEIKVHTTEKEKFAIVERLATDGDFGAGTVTSIDGIRVDYADGWGLIRPSNTSPVLTLRFEADDQAALTRIQRIFQTQLQRISPALEFVS
jgi:phosphomannomutase / phosphoglucomutase